jgi:hypothetical protein
VALASDRLLAHKRALFDHLTRRYGYSMDHGIPIEQTLERMRAADPPIRCVVGTPKARLSRLENKLLLKPGMRRGLASR